MRKAILSLCLIIGSLSALFGSTNMQKIYPIDSSEYEAIKVLLVHQGLALPSTAGPYSSDELSRMLNRIEQRSLAGPYQELYEAVERSIRPPSKSVNFTLNAALEAYTHTNTTDFITEEDWTFNFKQRSPLLELEMETSLGEFVYGYSSLPVQGSKLSMKTWANKPDPIYFNYGTKAFSTNLALFENLGKELDMGVPYRAFGSIGTSNLSFQVGREQLSWGAGKTGNFLLGDHLKYHNTARFTAYSDSFKYTLLTSFFPYPDEYYSFPVKSQMDTLHGLNMLLAHRLEWTAFKNKVGMALSEAIIYQSEDNTIDLRILSPTTIFHNYYIKANSNSLLTFEVDYTPIKNMNIYSQVVVDEFAVPGAEGAPGVAPSADPGAWGALVGVQGNYAIKDILLYGSVEGVYTNPYLYLRSKDGEKQVSGEAGINFIVAVPERFLNGWGVYYDEQFLGYRYGPDAIVFNVNFGAKQVGSWNVETNIFAMVHGTTDQGTLFDKVTPEGGDNPYQSTPTTNHSTRINRDPQAQNRDSATTTVDVTLKGSYQILPNLSLYAQADYIWIKNPKNISSNPAIHDLQLSVGVGYRL